MTLQPKKIKYKKFFKYRRCRLCFFPKKLNFGNCGLYLSQPTIISAGKLVKIALLLKKATKKSSFTRRLYWLNCFPHFPLTKKPLNFRMGKGKGKPKKWVAQVKPGLFLFEFRNLRIGRIKYFSNLIRFKLKTHTTLFFRSKQLLNYPLYISKKFKLTSF